MTDGAPAYLARAIHFDESDMNIFHTPARTGEWCISGGFEFSNWSEGDLTGKAKQAFANGWLGLETFGRVSVVAITKIEPAEFAVLTDLLAAHFVSHYGAPSIEAARGVASAELDANGRTLRRAGPEYAADAEPRVDRSRRERGVSDDRTTSRRTGPVRHTRIVGRRPAPTLGKTRVAGVTPVFLVLARAINPCGYDPKKFGNGRQ